MPVLGAMPLGERRFLAVVPLGERLFFGGDAVGGAPVSVGTDYNAVSTEEARDQLLTYLVHLKESGTRVSAKAVCELCWWISKSFKEQIPSGRLKAIAKRPGLQTGK